jgi:hypothetical protein
MIVENNLVGVYQAGSPDLKIESLTDVLRDLGRKQIPRLPVTVLWTITLRSG